MTLGTCEINGREGTFLHFVFSMIIKVESLGKLVAGLHLQDTKVFSGIIIITITILTNKAHSVSLTRPMATGP